MHCADEIVVNGKMKGRKRLAGWCLWWDLIRVWPEMSEASSTSSSFSSTILHEHFEDENEEENEDEAKA
jgi:hypothetical protein